MQNNIDIMKRFCENYKIGKYKKYISINDVIEKVLEKKNKSYYINKINSSVYKIYNDAKYIDKTTLIDFLNNCKNEEAKIAVKILTNKKENKKICNIIEGSDKTDKSDKLVDIGSGKLKYCDNFITINTTNGELWLKAKDICNILEYKNTKKTLFE